MIEGLGYVLPFAVGFILIVHNEYIYHRRRELAKHREETRRKERQRGKICK